MSRIDDLINELCPDGVEFKELHEVFDIRNGYTPSKNNNLFWDNGNIPWFRIEDIRQHGAELNDSIQHITKLGVKKCGLFKSGSIMLSTTATVGVHALVNTDYLSNQQITNFTIKEKYSNIILNKFAYYLFYKIDKECFRITNYCGTVFVVDQNKLRRLNIPLPPLTIQEEIVSILDKFTELQTELQAELQARIKQFEFYMEKLIEDSCSKGIEFIKIKEIADISTGSSNGKDAVENGDYPFFIRSKTVKYKNDYEFDEEAIVIPGEGGVGDIFHYIKGKYALHQRAYRIHFYTDTIITKFAYYVFKTSFKNFILRKAVNATVSSVRKPMIEDFCIPIPSLEIQKKIVSILDLFDKLCNDIKEGLPAEIEARQKQYEYYRDKLLTFKQKE